MATAKPGSKGAGVRHHPLVTRLAGDPASPPPRLVRLVGYPGPGADEDTTRLWLDLDFSQYVDVPNDKIVHAEDGTDDQPSNIWVAKGTKLEHTSVTSTDVEADFLSGAITDASLQGATASAQSSITAAFGNDRIDVNIDRFHSVFIRCFKLTQMIQSCVFFCNRDSIFCNTMVNPQCFQVTPPGRTDITTTPQFVEIGRRAVEAGLNPQPLPPREGPLTRPGG